MSANSRKGYAGEAPVRNLIALYASTVYRPRAGTHNDVGDLGGIPFVVSCKNQREYRLGVWVDELDEMVRRTEFNAGVVWHKRPGKGHPRDWYVTTSGGLYLPFMTAYLEKWEREHG